MGRLKTYNREEVVGNLVDLNLVVAVVPFRRLQHCSIASCHSFAVAELAREFDLGRLELGRQS